MYININKKLNYFKYKFYKFLLPFFFRTKIKKVTHYGSKVSGWDIVPNNSIQNSKIISCGVGEDISFEIELINKFNCKVILVDPTPRSIDHYQKIINNLGKKKTSKYALKANQKISSYNLENVKNKNLNLIKKAIYIRNNDVLDFFAPKNLKNVSYSLLVNENVNKKDFISVKTITIDEIINKYKIVNLSLIKLDIEGMASKIIENFIDKRIFPQQICFELDELNYLDYRKFIRILNLKKKLQDNNYDLVRTTDKMNFIFLKNLF
jgi:FkbM family methyltransferase